MLDIIGPVSPRTNGCPDKPGAGHTAQTEGIPPGTMLADAGDGVDTDFRDGITALGLAYVVGIQSSASLWLPGQ